MEGAAGDDKTRPAANLFDADGALSREFLLARGYCCREGCRNCPYGFKGDADQVQQ